VWDHKDFCILVAAGNDGTDKDGDGRINPMSVTVPGTAKNCITVGASENRRPDFNTDVYGDWWSRDYPVAPLKTNPLANNPEQMAAFSSRGPTKDGRFKPDVCAPGTFILSARSSMLAPNKNAWGAFPDSQSHFHMGGTSMATPLAAGAVGLLREYLRKKQNIKSPSAVLLKAALIVGAVRLPKLAVNGAVVDNHQGFGRIHIDAVVAPVSHTTARFLDVKRGLATGQASTRKVTIKSKCQPTPSCAGLLRLPRSQSGEQSQLDRHCSGREEVCRQPICWSPACARYSKQCRTGRRAQTRSRCLEDRSHRLQRGQRSTRLRFGVDRPPMR
jgi:hypothetical protein